MVFRQSLVPHHSELNLILSMITPVSWLERCPTYKEMQDNLETKDLSTFGFLGYPVLMAADIILYKATRVPVGHDQLPHLEVTREITRRFNYLYGNVFPEPEALLTETPKLLGLDGRKMSKSYGNSIYLSDSAEETSKKVMSMVTDTERVRRADPGDPERCVAFNLHRIYVPQEKLDEIIPACKGALPSAVSIARRSWPAALTSVWRRFVPNAKNWPPSRALPMISWRRQPAGPRRFQTRSWRKSARL